MTEIILISLFGIALWIVRKWERQSDEEIKGFPELDEFEKRLS
jgi:hypothetical protein